MSELINIPNDKGRTPLMAACKGGHADCVSFLLQNQVGPRFWRAFASPGGLHAMQTF